MSERDHDPQQASGVEEATTPWVTPPVLHARPVQGPIDWDALLSEIERDFPKTLARLAE